MSRRLQVLTFLPLGLALLLALLPPQARARREPARRERRAYPAYPDDRLICLSGTQSSGALYQVCVPLLLPPWNGELILYAHGYVSPEEPLGIPAEFGDLSFLANLLGYGTAATSYSKNGLAVLPAIPDLLELPGIVENLFGRPSRIYVVGPSMGGLVATLMVEQGHDGIDGGLAICAPNGDFAAQTNYIGDFRVVFDYFFPGLMPGSPDDIPQWLIDGWEDHYSAVIQPATSDPANAGLLDQLFAVTGAASDPNDPSSREHTIERLLWYNVFATNDARSVLGGQPFDNQGRIYGGSDDDSALNAGVARFAADPQALAEIEANYQTSGMLGLPLLTDHTTLDELVPFWHSELYEAKVLAAGSGPYFARNSADRYGHCNFTASEILDDFLQLVDMVASPPATPTATASPTATLTSTPGPSPSPTAAVVYSEVIYMPAVVRED